MKRPKDRELVIDSFAGGGGASLGLMWAGHAPDIAINHDDAAIKMHAANHPQTQHFTRDIWRLKPQEVTRGQAVGLAWFSPDCAHFSRAKGGKPVKKEIRSLAWIVIKWAAEVRPRVIILENVREFEQWGPLVQKHLGGEPQWLPDGSPVLVPDPSRQGHSFKRWAGRLRGLGYEVQWRVLNAADYGAPTHRRRLFLIARCDGKPIVWPEPTHGDPKKIAAAAGGLFGDDRQPWRTAAECIDWSLPCPSIFERKKPLAEKTLRRIALGVKRYVLENPRPFLVPVTHNGERRPNSIGEPMPTVTGANRGEIALVQAFIANLAYGEKGRWGNGVNGIDEPVTTIHSGGKNHAVVAANLIRFNHDDAGVALDQPSPTVTASGQHAALVYSFLTKYYGIGVGQSVGEPLHTITPTDRFGLVAVTVDGQTYVIVDIGMRMLTPRELARAQGFPDSYTLTGTKTNQVARIGNSVPPIMAKVLAEANYRPMAAKRKQAIG